MGKEKRIQEGSIKEKLRMRYREISTELQGQAVILHGQTSATAYACKRILLYTPTQIRLGLSQGQVVAICGKKLYCVSFSGGTVNLAGDIHAVCFLRHGEVPFCQAPTACEEAKA